MILKKNGTQFALIHHTRIKSNFLNNVKRLKEKFCFQIYNHDLLCLKFLPQIRHLNMAAIGRIIKNCPDF